LKSKIFLTCGSCYRAINASTASTAFAADPPGKGTPKLKDKIALFRKAEAAAAISKPPKTKQVAQLQAAIIDPATGLMLTDYFGVANWANSPVLTKFVDALPGLGPSANNSLGQFILSPYR